MKRKLIRAAAALLCLALLLQLTGLPLPASAEPAPEIWDGSVAAAFDGGTGTEEDPYIIRTPAQLAYLAQSVNGGTSYEGQYLRLEADILLNDTTDWELWGIENEAGNIVAPVNAWTPIGNVWAYFCGCFDGNGKTVKGIYIRSTERGQGLFGSCSRATIRNLSVSESSITGGYEVGAIAGEIYGTVENCHNTGTVKGKWNIGGVAGAVSNSGVALNCTNRGKISGNFEIGGVVGSSNQVVQNCCNTGSVLGDHSIGGVVGNASRTVENCYNMGEISGSFNTGGIAGEASGAVQNCYNTGSVLGDHSIGGIAGQISGGGSVRCCYNVGEVSGRNDFGGVTGTIWIDGSEQQCYYLETCVTEGSAYGTALTDEAMRTESSFAGWNFSSIWELGYDADYHYPTLRSFGSRIYQYLVSFYDGDTLLSERLVSDGDEITMEALAGDTLADGTVLDFGYWENDGAHYLPGEIVSVRKDSVFHAIRTTRNTSPGVWNGTADMEWAGSGTQTDPYLITTAEELAGLAFRVNRGESFYDKYFFQTANIVLNDCGDSFSRYVAGKNDWTPIGGEYEPAGYNRYSFAGNYDGGGNAVSGMYLSDLTKTERGRRLGLFGYVRGTVKRLRVVRSYVESGVSAENDWDAIGGVVGESFGTVENCDYSGRVVGSDNVGGVVGYASNAEAVRYCTNSGTVVGNGDYAYAGGIAGIACSVEACSNAGSVMGSGKQARIGGVTGYVDRGTVRDSYNTGSVTGSGKQARIGGVTGCIPYGSAVSRCNNAGMVTGNSENSIIGGVAGHVDRGTVQDSYNTGSVAGSGEWSSTGGVAGLVGGGGTVENCYNTGSVTGSGNYARFGGVAGDVEGYLDEGTVQSSYYLDSCIAEGNAYGEALTDGAMRTQSAFADWDFNKTWELGYQADFPYPTLRCFGSRIYYYRVSFFDGDEIASEHLVRDGTRLTMSALAGGAGLDFGYWERDGLRYPAGSVFVVTEDASFLAIRTTRNTSSAVWNGTVDTDWAGSGTQDDPWLIYTAEELAGLAARVNQGESYSGKFFCQMADIVLNDGGGRFSRTVAGKNDWTPIGDGAIWGGWFSGTYDGKEHSVSGMYLVDRTATLENPQCMGLFGSVKSGYVKNLRVIGTYVERGECSGYHGSDLGGVAGNAEEGILQNCHFSGSVTGASKYSRVGGILGAGELADGCTVKGVVSGNGSYTGGIVGYGTAQFCQNESTVTGSGDFTGGVVGSGTVYSCENTGTVTGAGEYTGGVAGRVIERITDSRNEGAVTGAYNTGGIAGYAEGQAVVKNCFNTGTVTGTEVNVGGVIGNAGESTVQGCRNLGAVSGYDTYTGGIAGTGSLDGVIQNCSNGGVITARGSYVCVGGIAGYALMRECYNTGAATGFAFAEGGEADVGGIGGSGAAINCYNTGDVSGTISAEIGDAAVGGIMGYGSMRACYNVGKVKGYGEKTWLGGVAGYISYNGVVRDSYYLNTCVANGNDYGTALTETQMWTQEAYEGFDFVEYWEQGTNADYLFPTLRNIPHVITYTVTFVDSDGETVLSTQTVQKGEDAEPPEIPIREDGDWVYALDHWEGSYTNVTSNRTVRAVMRQTAIIKFTDVSVPITVEYGFSRDNLRVMLEELYTRLLCTTTNGYRMSCEAVWSAADIAAYQPRLPGEYVIRAALTITESPYYAMAEGCSVQAAVTLGNTDGEAAGLEFDDLSYTVLPDGKSVSLTGYAGSAAELSLPESILGYSLVEIGENAFADCASLVSVSIPASVTRIGSGAFRGAGALVQAVLPEGLQSIGEKAFFDTGLPSATVPASVTQIGEKAFGYYEEDAAITDFTVYGSAGSAAQAYAEQNGFAFVPLTVQTDAQSGVTAQIEEGLTLVVSEVTEEGFRETAQSIVEENDNVSLIEIKLTDGETEVQPGSVMTVSIPVPSGFDAQRCKVFRINSDGSYREMGASLLDGNLVFRTGHLSCYAVVETDLHVHVIEFVPDTEPTCTEDGCHAHFVCAGCGKRFEDVNGTVGLPPESVILPALGHDYTEAGTTAPTCTEGGYTTYTCSRCGESYAADETEALGHEFGAWIQTKAPTCAAAGEDSRVCARCGATERREVSALAHTPGEPIEERRAEPSCTSPGSYDTAIYCTVCRVELSREHTELPAHGHDWNTPGYVWAEDLSGIIATRVCGRDASHVETERGAVTSEVTKEATYEAEGEITYTATFGNPAFETQTKTVPTPKLEKPILQNPFADVKDGAFYYDAVLWAVNTEPQVTAGTSATAFSPKATCTRAQVVAFLWRAMGCPEPKGTSCPFTDVKSGAYYEKAVLWAVENDVTAGTSASRFSPNQGCTRAQVVTFLWRAEGRPQPKSSENPFRDVTGGYYYDAVLWAVEHKITEGTGATTFSPQSTCTRGQIVTFLWRDFAGKE